MSNFADIYILKSNKINILKQFLPGEVLTDFKDENIITLTNEEAKTKKIFDNNWLICTNCKSPTFFIHNISNDFLCPCCRVTKYGSFGNCNFCEFKNGCDSCGGRTRKMCSNNGVTLCANDICLMPFKLNLGLETHQCTCAIEALKDLENFLDKDTHSIVKSYIKISVRKSIILGDLTKVTTCVKCYLEDNYTKITNFNYVKKCNCF
jgi:hypothetical protein